MSSEMAIRHNRRTTRTELKSFCRWIYFHLRSRIFFRLSYGGRSLSSPHWCYLPFAYTADICKPRVTSATRKLRVCNSDCHYSLVVQSLLFRPHRMPSVCGLFLHTYVPWSVCVGHHAKTAAPQVGPTGLRRTCTLAPPDKYDGSICVAVF